MVEEHPGQPAEQPVVVPGPIQRPKRDQRRPEEEEAPRNRRVVGSHRRRVGPEVERRSRAEEPGPKRFAPPVDRQELRRVVEVVHRRGWQGPPEEVESEVVLRRVVEVVLRRGW